MGLTWIPLSIGIQFLLLYALLGGPGTLLGRLAGHDDFEGREAWGKMQVGFPVALVLAFPSLTVLALIEKWLHQVGLLDVLIVQSLSLVLLMRWPKRTSAHNNNMGTAIEEGALSSDHPPELAFSEMDPASTDAIEAPIAIPLTILSSLDDKQPSPDTAKVVPPLPVEHIQNEGMEKDQGILKRLKKIYLWDNVGLERIYVEARNTPISELISPEDIAILGERHISVLCTEARATVTAAFRENEMGFTGGFSEDIALDRMEYERDVMRRLTLSVLVGHEQLFIDQTDVELCGNEMLLIMYRIALLEAKEGGASYKASLH